MKFLTIALFLIFSFFSFAQEIDLSGKWYGNYTWMGSQAELMYSLSQDGNDVSAIATSYNSKGDSIVSRMEGTYEPAEQTLILKAQEVLFKKGKGCMSDNKLVFMQQQGQLKLIGKWSGNAKLSTCPPLVSGNVTLFQEQEVLVASEPRLVSRSNGNVEISPEDDLGQSLLRELGKRNYYALVIGIDDYKSDDIQDLDNPVNDARKVADVLTTSYTFDPELLTLLKNPTREEIIRALDQLAKIVKEKDHLLIFYAGHGIWNAQLQQGYWLPSDASMDSKSFWLSNSTLRDYIGGIQSKHTLLVSDACFSGGILKERGVFENSRAILEQYKLPSRKAMTSGTMTTVPDKSVFISYLLKNLKNNQEPLLSADQLFRNFKMAVINNSPNNQLPQYGPISQVGDEGGDFIFLRRLDAGM
ncbi:MAG: caspase family protein [Bacteroidota bacterium]